jgi:hypothetical protein
MRNIQLSKSPREKKASTQPSYIQTIKLHPQPISSFFKKKKIIIIIKRERERERETSIHTQKIKNPKKIN